MIDLFLMLDTDKSGTLTVPNRIIHLSRLSACICGCTHALGDTRCAARVCVCVCVVCEYVRACMHACVCMMGDACCVQEEELLTGLIKLGAEAGEIISLHKRSHAHLLDT
jgi:hypothetical protein